jgi:hypothetical protein
MVRDIVDAIAGLNGDVEAMEVVAKVLYIRFRVPQASLQSVRERVLDVPSVHSVMDVEKLPFEADEARLVLRVMNQEDAQSDLSFANLVYQSKGMEQGVQMGKAAAQSPLPRRGAAAGLCLSTALQFLTSSWKVRCSAMLTAHLQARRREDVLGCSKWLTVARCF